LRADAHVEREPPGRPHRARTAEHAAQLGAGARRQLHDRRELVRAASAPPNAPSSSASVRAATLDDRLSVRSCATAPESARSLLRVAVAQRGRRPRSFSLRRRNHDRRLRPIELPARSHDDERARSSCTSATETTPPLVWLRTRNTERESGWFGE
jgi:hypothetical protein